jgi:hypothetical protein
MVTISVNHHPSLRLTMEISTTQRKVIVLLSQNDENFHAKNDDFWFSMTVELVQPSPM